MNPFTLQGPQFLLLYVVCWAGFGAVAWLLRKIAVSSDSAPTRAEMACLHPYEMAYLMRGPEGAIESSVAALVAAGYLAVSPKGLKSALRDEQSYAHFHELDQGVLKQCSALRPPLGLELALRSILDVIRDGLLARGFLLVEQRTRYQRTAVRVCGIALLAAGGIKVLVGMAWDRPVGVLLMLMVLAWVLFTQACQPWSRWTNKGEQAKRDLLCNYAGLNRARRPISSVEVAMATGIFGLGAVAHGAVGEDLTSLFYESSTQRTRSKRRSAASSSIWFIGGSGSCSSCSTSSCGSSCGGGGCGGGGCGGCAS